MYKKLAIPLLFCILSSQQAQAIQREELILGTRAMGMAGIFDSQSDDSTGVFYNPAGLIFAAEHDITIEQGTLDAENDIQEPNLIAYAFGQRNTYKPVSMSIAYANKFKKRLDAQKADISSQGLYLGFAGKTGQDLSFGMSINYITNQGEYDAFSVDESKSFFALNYGLISSLIEKKYFHMSVAGSYQIMLGSEGLSGAEKNNIVYDSVPNEPQKYSLGANIKVPTPYFLLSANYVYSSSSYDYDSDTRDLPSKTTTGYSAELHIPVWKKIALSLRMGHKEDEWSDLSENIVTDATGFGLSYANAHFIDMATAVRDPVGNAKKLEYTSISYAYQF